MAKSDRPTTPKSGKERRAKLAWNIALKKAGGDESRLRIEPDGSVMVLNAPQASGAS